MQDTVDPLVAAQECCDLLEADVVASKQKQSDAELKLQQLTEEMRLVQKDKYCKVGAHQ